MSKSITHIFVGPSPILTSNSGNEVKIGFIHSDDKIFKHLSSYTINSKWFDCTYLIADSTDSFVIQGKKVKSLAFRCIKLIKDQKMSIDVLFNYHQLYSFIVPINHLNMCHFELPLHSKSEYSFYKDGISESAVSSIDINIQADKKISFATTVNGNTDILAHFTPSYGKEQVPLYLPMNNLWYIAGKHYRIESGYLAVTTSSEKLEDIKLFIQVKSKKGLREIQLELMPYQFQSIQKFTINLSKFLKGSQKNTFMFPIRHMTVEQNDIFDQLIDTFSNSYYCVAKQIIMQAFNDASNLTMVNESEIDRDKRIKEAMVRAVTDYRKQLQKENQKEDKEEIKPLPIPTPDLSSYQKMVMEQAKLFGPALSSKFTSTYQATYLARLNSFEKDLIEIFDSKTKNELWQTIIESVSIAIHKRCLDSLKKNDIENHSEWYNFLKKIQPGK